MNLNPTEIVLILAGAIALAGYVGFILLPAWTSYGRMWERFAASFLTLYMLDALLGLGAAIGFGLVYFYDNYN